MKSTRLSMLLVGLVACSAPARTSSTSPVSECRQPIAGEPSQMRTPIDSPWGPKIDAPMFCDEPDRMGREGYVRVHGSGTRKLGVGRELIDAGCSVPDASADRCPVLEAGSFGTAVMERLRALGIETLEVGRGVCGNAAGDYDAWNMSITVRDWQVVDATIDVVANELQRWNVGNSFGISVRGTQCWIIEGIATQR